MRILIDILHPAHVHFFRNAIVEWRKNHEVLITSRYKDITTNLLDASRLPHEVISTRQGGLIGLGAELLKRDFKLKKIADNFRPTVVTGVAGVCASHVAAMLNIPSVIFYDTENATLINKLTHPFATTVHTPDCYSSDILGDHRRYSSYHELAYLHPSRFKPELKFIKPLACLPGTYFILRFVEHSSSHDRKRDNLSTFERLTLVEKLKPFGKVFISSESNLDASLNDYRLPTKPEVFHHILANCRMVIGDSATVCSEAAALGVPSVYLSASERGYINELSEKYSLVKILRSKDFARSMSQLDDLLQDPNLGERTKNLNEIMLREKIDLTDYIVKAVEEPLIRVGHSIEQQNKTKFPNHITQSS